MKTIIPSNNVNVKLAYCQIFYKYELNLLYITIYFK